LWQIAAVIGRARALRMPIRLPPWKYADAFNVPGSWFQTPRDDDVEVFDTVDYLPPEAKYFLQDLRLWWEFESQVRAYLSPSRAVVRQTSAVYPEVDAPDGATAVHVRRGDYLRLSDVYPLPSAQYYLRALAQWSSAHTIVFTDDPQWCANSELARVRAVRVATCSPGFIDLAAMSRCRRHVIANSSFSWWGAFLADSSAVVYPSQWYGSGFADADTAHLVPPGWESGE
jgi:hypothetical protein